MQISEIFYSLQGEGINIGVPSIFLRLSGCHLRCLWCDTKYTWPLKSGTAMTIDEVVTEIAKFPSKNLVITGGEPLIQQPDIKALIQRLPAHHIEIETSGSIPSELGPLVHQFNCSPKLSNSGNKEITFHKLPTDRTWYKFVVSDTENLAEIKAFIAEHDLPQDRIILMPQGISEEELQERSEWLAEICKEQNFRFSPRLHINIWGNKRGV